MYRVMSRLSSMRAPTESSTDFAEAGVTCIRPPRTRLIAVAAARREGGRSIASPPPPEPTVSIHATEENS
jgi:hypothetical protein